MSEITYNKPVVCIFKERSPNPEVDPFVVVKARKMILNKTQTQGFPYTCEMLDFFALMGDADYLLSSEGAGDRYVICWFDDAQSDVNHDFRRLGGASLKEKPLLSYTESGKRKYNAKFTAKHAKLQ